MKYRLSLIVLLLFAVVVPLYADAPMAGRAGRAELRFLQGMVDHHQMALDMAGHCLEKAQDARVKSICTGVIAAQTVEIEQMRGWIKAWYGVDYAPIAMLPSILEAGKPSPHGGHGASVSPSDPVMMMGMFAGLTRLSGTAYDVAWLEAMVDHHDDALHMSERLLRHDALHAETRTLAEAIILVQTAEIAEMEALLVELMP